jgi:hypothetical protein
MQVDGAALRIFQRLNGEREGAAREGRRRARREYRKVRVYLRPVLDGRRLHAPAKAVRPFGSWLSMSVPCRDTALHLASRNGHTESVKALLGKGADVNAKNSSRKTAFQVAKDRRAYVAAVKVRCVRAIAA